MTSLQRTLAQFVQIPLSINISHTSAAKLYYYICIARYVNIIMRYSCLRHVEVHVGSKVSPEIHS